MGDVSIFLFSLLQSTHVCIAKELQVDKEDSKMKSSIPLFSMEHRTKKDIVYVACMFCSVIIAGSAFAKPNTTRVTATNTRSGVSVTIPAHALEVAPDVFSLGTAVVDGKSVEGMMIIHRREAAKPANPGGGKSGASKCSALLAKGAKWRAAEPWVLNPANSNGLTDSFLLANTALNIQKWEDAASANILGEGSLTAAPLVADEVSPDGVNEIYFGNIAEPGVIAVTITWGVFGGAPSARELVETDQVYDEVDFAWSEAGEAGKMDYENISTHELGHSLGMGHPDDSCTEETMYRFSTEGETKKRDLHTGDVAGIAGLY
ncbi:hypothetical protein A2424_05955 [Candidatus Peribacteria bacterium RIFOXYC1_FULL_54_13]|nr:MAG: hypothetical protein UY85_C0023G0003 [Candidatus Peribacteria bacterium GW2011_GWB1_54_5]KKW40162.1 MAG: hypothetical protein UY90_C0087G0009 [Candidatus Peregrinibacteria bacterium GW2011_GWA2_54_9]KKW40926.1 MAG: hypothetical protein UY87_C0008G0020 [Candidatus Peribacteria bacterium GW2011_GWC2_54_8]OGJ72084.1 MAG: hypothetical protein A2198_04410 [Candidatus Peribacteria bacterium RIFOXYA1_FULL_56_14]OGJ74097.1 MAG: hypothetical protein A2217_00430 [Candidatus Peribacteria bacterium